MKGSNDARNKRQVLYVSCVSHAYNINVSTFHSLKRSYTGKQFQKCYIRVPIFSSLCRARQTSSELSTVFRCNKEIAIQLLVLTNIKYKKSENETSNGSRYYSIFTVTIKKSFTNGEKKICKEYRIYLERKLLKYFYRRLLVCGEYGVKRKGE